MGKIPIHLFQTVNFQDITIEIRSQPATERLDSHVSRRFAYLSRNYVQKLIRNGAIRVNGQPARPSRRLQAGDRLDLHIPVMPERVIEPEQIELDILYEDADLLVINKPRDISCHAGTRYHGGTLANAVLYHIYGTHDEAGRKNPGIVHRLDKNTTGAMAFAKHLRSHQVLSKQFVLGHVQKEYLAVVKGNPKRHRGVIDTPIGFHPYLRNTMSVRMDAVSRKAAVTHYTVQERFGHGATVSLLPKTGRTHQLRIHLESIGHPMFGEDRYRGHYPWSAFDKVIGRQALHAWRLSLAHPTTGNPMTFEAGMPADISRLVSLLRAGAPEGD
jgi:23S rRNA pseudouridine1911/1915/1917 synthase